MRPAKLAAFWGAVAGVAVMANIGFNIASDHLGHVFPSLKTLNDYSTRRNG